MSSIISSAINPVSLDSLTGLVEQAPERVDAVETEEFEQFLALLLTQLENQSPLDPLETEQFTSQLTSFSILEQSVAENQNLEELIALQRGNSDFNAVSYLGSEVTFDGEFAPIQNATAQWDYTFSDAVSEYTLEVTNANEEVVYSATVNEGTAPGTFSFNLSALESAINVTEGEVLTLQVLGVGEGGEARRADIRGKAIINSVDSSSGEPVLEAGGLSLTINNINGVRSPQAPPARTADPEPDSAPAAATG